MRFLRKHPAGPSPGVSPCWLLSPSCCLQDLPPTTGAWPAPDACFQDVNMAGNTYGNCGKDSQGRYVKCDKRWVPHPSPAGPIAHPEVGLAGLHPHLQHHLQCLWFGPQKPPGPCWAWSPSLLGGRRTVCHLPAQPEGKTKGSICRRVHLRSVCAPVSPVRAVILEGNCLFPPAPLCPSLSPPSLLSMIYLSPF